MDIEDDHDQRRSLGWQLDDVADVPQPSRVSPLVHWNELGDGWEFVEEALTLVQGDFSRTLPDAPVLGLAWHDDESRGRVLYVGTGLDRYFGAHGGLFLKGDVVDATIVIAEAVQDALADNLMGYRTLWPLCTLDGGPLYARAQDDLAQWHCGRDDSHRLGAVGELRL